MDITGNKLLKLFQVSNQSNFLGAFSIYIKIKINSFQNCFFHSACSIKTWFFTRQNRDILKEFSDLSLSGKDLFTLTRFECRIGSPSMLPLPSFSPANANLVQWHLLLFKRDLQNRTRLEDPLFNFFGTVRLFFRKFLVSQKGPPFVF